MNKESIIVEALKPNSALIPESAVRDLKRLSELTGHPIDALVAGWWLRFGEVQTLQMELEFRNAIIAELESKSSQPSTAKWSDSDVKKLLEDYRVANMDCYLNPVIWFDKLNDEK